MDDDVDDDDDERRSWRPAEHDPRPAPSDATPRPAARAAPSRVDRRRGWHAGPGSKLSAEELEQLTADIVTALKTVYDPEIPSDIYELGLIYKIDIDDDRLVADRHDADRAGLPGRRRDAEVGRERRQHACPASPAPRST